MALADRIQTDRSRIFLNPKHFAETHTWNGIPFLCVTDEEEALKRKNNNVVDLNWDNNSREVLVYVRREDWPGRENPNEHGFYDKKPMKILQISNDGNMLAIMLATFDPKAVAT